MPSDMQIMVHGMSVQFCDDEHHTAQHDYSTNAHAYCFDDASAVQAQLCAFLHVNSVERACHKLGTTCSLTWIHDTHIC